MTELAGGNVFLMGFLPRQEVVREVAYARQQGLTRFAALVPSSPYGRLMADALREVAPASRRHALPRSNSSTRAPAMSRRPSSA